MQGTARGLKGAYGEYKGSQDQKIVMVSITKGSQERKHSMERRDEEKSATQEENRNIIHICKQQQRHVEYP